MAPKTMPAMADPRLVEVLVGPGTDQPADDGRAGKHESNLEEFFGLHDGCDAAGHL